MFPKVKEAQRDANPRKLLPFKGHVSENVVLCDNGELLAVMRLGGRSFQTMDIWEVNDWHNKLNIALRSVGHDRLAVHSYMIRRARNEYPGGDFPRGFERDLNAAYRDSLAGKRMYSNELYLAVVQRRSVGHSGKAADRIGALFTKQRDDDADLSDRVDDFNGTLRDLGKLLGSAEPRLLTLYERDGLQFSQVLEFLNKVLSGRDRALPLVRGHLSGALFSDRIIFGNEVIELREPGGSRFAGILGVREHAAVTFPGMLNGLLGGDFECVLSQSFGFLSKPAAAEQARKKMAQLVSTDDVAISQTDELAGAQDSLQSNEFVLGEHSLQLMVFGNDVKRLNENLSVARAIMSEGGMVAAREDLALEAAYWSQLPANYNLRPRPALITSRNYAALSPFHTYPIGQAEGNHWGPAICILKTSSRSPYYFNFHVGDIGHTLIIGPTGSGKTVLQNFLLAQSRKLGVRQFFIDKDRGAEIYVRAAGGTYLSLENGKPTGFAPLKALELTPNNRAFLARWLRELVTVPGDVLTSQDNELLDAALAALAEIPQDERTISALRSMLPVTDLEGIGPRLDRWALGGELDWVFDNDEDQLALDTSLAGFDMTDFLDNEAIRPPLMSYLFHRIDTVIDGRPTIVDIDEFWKALGDRAFTTFARDGLKTYRKRNAMMLFGTQSPVDALNSDISSTIVEQCSTKILLPNPAARREDYVDGLALTETEFDLIKHELSAESRRFLIKQAHNSVVAELDLGGLDDELAVLSGRASTVELLDRLRAQVGDDPDLWLPLFHEQRAGLR